MRKPIKWSACNPCEQSRRGVWKRDEGYGEVGREWEGWVGREGEGDGAGRGPLPTTDTTTTTSSSHGWVRREWEGQSQPPPLPITMEREQGTPAFAHNGHDDDIVVVVARM